LDSDELTFFKFYENFLSDFEKEVNNGLRVNCTLNRYKILLTYLRNFALIRYGYSDLSFKDLTWDCVQEFDYYRRDDQSLNLNFSCFKGLSYYDIKGFKNSNIQEFFDGNQWLLFVVKKPLHRQT